MKPSLLIILILVLSWSVSGQLNDPLVLGNPSNAASDLSQSNNYLVTHNGYELSYNKERGAANWVAWHLQKSDIGKAERTDAFAPDTTLPTDWWIKPSDYTGSGYDRGHMIPSKDRSSSEDINRVTFLMSNMQPQAPKLNEKTWKYLEDYTRELVSKGNEAYVYAGCYGNKGRIKDKVTIPSNCFKIIVVLPEGDDDLKRISVLTRVIAVDMPNDESVSIRWRTYLTTVDEIESKTGFDFLSNVSNSIQAYLESKKDSESAETGGNDRQTGDKGAPSVNTDSNGRKYYLGAKGGCYYLTASGKKSYVDKKYCSDEEAPPEPPKKIEPEPPTITESGDRKYIRGPKGGCYYINGSGKKIYVDKSLCN